MKKRNVFLLGLLVVLLVMGLVLVGCGDDGSGDNGNNNSGGGGNNLVGTRWVYGNLSAGWGVTVTFSTSNTLTVTDTANPRFTWNGNYSKSGDTINVTISDPTGQNIGGHAGTFVWTIISGNYFIWNGQNYFKQ